VIHPVHTRVQGRARYRVDGLQRSETFKAFLEKRLADRGEILDTSVSLLTGTVLVTYNSNNTATDIAKTIHLLATEFQPPTAAPPAGRRLKPAATRKKTAPPPKPNQQRLSRSKTAKPHADPLAPVPAKRTLPVVQKAKAVMHHLAPAKQPPLATWHTADREAVLELLSTDTAQGLAPGTAEIRRRDYGPNRLPEPVARSGMEIIWEQINSLPTYLLAAAAGVSVVTGGLLDAAIIMGVVAANACIGYVTESRAEKTIHALKRLAVPEACVLRAGVRRTLPADQLVVGDIIFLKPGLYVPADCRVLGSQRLTIDESMLTGESLPALKSTRRLGDDNLALGDRRNMAYMSTFVTGGQGVAVVTATGPHTEIGHLQRLLLETQTPKTPIERQLGQMGDQLVVMCGVICGGVFGIGFLRGYGMAEMLRTSISLAAAAVPEGLPAAATINFALGVNSLREHRILIRHLQAIETLGAVQVLCLDKTGTLTRNQMQVQAVYCNNKMLSWEAAGPTNNATGTDIFADKALRKLVVSSALCNETTVQGRGRGGDWNLSGSATEVALVQMGLGIGLDVTALRKAHKLIKLHHRSECRLYMSALHKTKKGKRKLSVKGSPPEVLSLCTHQLVGNERLPLDDAARRRIEVANEEMAARALRVLGVAYKPVSADSADSDDPQAEGLTWLGLVGMADPIRLGSRELIKTFHRAGIKTVMITGDQSATAQAVAEELNLSGDAPLEILDTAKLANLPKEKLAALSQKVHVYARVSPAHKLQIVQAIQASGQTVAMTGDGINDGPALKAANVGIAMGQSGNEVARDVADVILETDDLAHLAEALRGGRTTYGNIRKSVHYFLSTNISEVMLMFSAMGLGLGFPLNVMQLLWINLISDILPGLALAMEPPEADLMEKPPRDASRPLFTRDDFKKMTRESAAITAGALGAYGYGLSRFGAGARATTLSFQSLTIGQLMHALICRKEENRGGPVRASKPNPYLAWAVGGSLGLQALTLSVPPLRRFLGLSALGLTDFAVVTAGALVPMVANQLSNPKLKKKES
jgi:Ca2+-transporting ATPase